jgi:hypothetical protein
VTSAAMPANIRASRDLEAFMGPALNPRPPGGAQLRSC